MTCVSPGIGPTIIRRFHFTMIASHNLSHFSLGQIYSNFISSIFQSYHKTKTSKKAKTQYLLLHEHYQHTTTTRSTFIFDLNYYQTMILTAIARYSLLLQLATTATFMPAASGAHLRRLSFSSSPEGPVHVWLAVPVKTDGCCVFDDAADSCPDDIYADEPKCHYFQEDCETMCNGRWISADATP